VWKLDKSRLHVTVFEGDPANGIPRDEEAAGFWKAVGVPPERVHLGNKKDNFWEMGATGPCGPCTEVHYDATPDRSGGPLVNAGTDKVIEIWNLVFIQFNRNEDQTLTPLPAKHVDTGMGFERITKVIQGKSSNYDTDVFQPIFAAIQKVTGAAPYTGVLDDLKDTAYRVIADHIRTLTFALTDGAAIGNEGRNYVLKRILRRAERYGAQVLGTKEPFLHALVPTVVELMGGAFPELKANPAKVRAAIYAEEEGFLRTLKRGIKLFDELVEKMGAEGRTQVSAEEAFKLHDTYGVLIDITQQIAQEKGLSVDIDAVHHVIDTRPTGKPPRPVVSAIQGELPPTDDAPKYGTAQVEATVVGWIKDNTVVRAGKLVAGDSVALLLDKTGFYGEQGGQVGDIGTIVKRGASGSTSLDDADADFEVDDTQRLGNTVLHVGVLHAGELSVGDRVLLIQSIGRRVDVMRNHTATHLMNLALRQVLGGDVDQRGSLVDENKTRFDFTHDKPLTAEQLREVEDRVNRQIIRDHVVAAAVMPLAEAKQLPGVRAVFGEKYPDPVRVVMVGTDDPAHLAADMSVEFCGGTHVPRTGTIGLFKLVSQEGVAKGVRRVTAVTGRAAYADAQARGAVLDELSGRFHCKPDELPARIDALQEQVKKLQEQLKKGAAADLGGVVDKLLEAAPTFGGAKVVIGQLPDGTTSDAARAQVDRVRQKAGASFVVFGWTEEGGKVPFLAAMTPELVKKGVKAGDVVKQVAAVTGGSGGGKPDLAQAGGKDAAKLPEALAKARELAEQLLK